MKELFITLRTSGALVCETFLNSQVGKVSSGQKNAFILSTKLTRLFREIGAKSDDQLIFA